MDKAPYHLEVVYFGTLCQTAQNRFKILKDSKQ